MGPEFRQAALEPSPKSDDSATKTHMHSTTVSYMHHKERNPTDDLAQLIDISKILFGIRRRWKLVIVISIICALLGLVISLFFGRGYQADSILVFQQDLPKSLPGGYALSRLTLPTAVDLVTLPTNFGPVRNLLGLKISEQQIQDMVSVVSPQRNSNLIRIRCQSRHDPDLAINVANALAKEVVKVSNTFNQQQLKQASEFYLRDVSEKRVALDHANEGLAKFRSENSLTDVDPSQTSLIQKIADVEKKLQDVTLEYNGVSVQLQNIRRTYQESPEQIARGSVESSPLRSRLERGELALVEAKARYAPENPRIRVLEEQVIELRKLVEQESQTPQISRVYEPNPFKSSLQLDLVRLESQLRMSQRLRDDLQLELEELKKNLATLPEKHSALMRLIRNKNSLQEAVQSGEQVLATIEMLSTVDKSDLEIYQPAQGAEIVNSIIVYILPILGLILGCGGVISLIIMIEVLDGKFRTRRQVEKIYGVPCLALIPDFETDVSLASIPIEQSPVLPYVRRLISRIQVLQEREMRGTVGFASSLRWEGRTTLAVAVAGYFSLLNRRVLYLCFQDAKEQLQPFVTEDNYHHIQLHEFVEKVVSGTIVELTKGNFLILHLIVESDSHEWVNNLITPDIFHRLNQLFTHTVVDIPGTFEVDFGEYLARMIPTLLFIIASDVVTKSIVDSGLGRYEMYGVSPLGIILNKVPHSYIEHMSL